MNNQPFAWGPLLCKMQVEDSVLNDLLWETKRGDEEYNAEANLVATMHDEWAFAPETIEWFERAITEQHLWQESDDGKPCQENGDGSPAPQAVVQVSPPRGDNRWDHAGITCVSYLVY